MKHEVYLLLGLLVLPSPLLAQQVVGEVASLQQVLDTLYQDMIPLCTGLIAVGQGIAGFAALWYIGSRVWQQLARAESIDFYPLFRPFVLGCCIAFFPGVIGLTNSILQPAVAATRRMVGDSDRAIRELLIRREEQLKQTDGWQMYVGNSGDGDRNRWYQYTYQEPASEEGMLEEVGNDIKFAMAKASYSFRHSVKEWLSEVLQLLFEAAALCINTLRTFQLIVLAILGPLAFGISVFDGFTHLVKNWLTRYIHVFLWLPVANIFGSILGKIQQNMLQLDLAQLQETGDTFFSRTDSIYLIFLLIGIVGYFTVPTVAGYIVSVASGDAFNRQVGASISGAAGMAGYGAMQATQQLSSSTASRADSGLRPAESSNYLQERLGKNQTKSD